MRANRCRLSSVLGVAFFLVVTGLLAACTAGHQPGRVDDAPLTPLVRTSLGALEGEYADTSEDVLVFRGVPFAAPPIGERRWKPPVPVAAWESIRASVDYGPACWQEIGSESSIWSKGPLQRDEDCLTLNIWTSALDRDDRHPVMVWFHGGGHTAGTGSSSNFDGTSLARKGVVLVTVNYRLGALGFMAHPALTAESPHGSSGNYGLLDKIGALEWIRDQIRNFGGDPDRVTIFGQSAGSHSACALMVSPLAAGLFHRVIGQSGSCVDRPYRSVPEDAFGSIGSAHEGGLAIAAVLGVKGAEAEAASALRAMSPESLLEARAETGASTGVIIDGWVVPDVPRTLFESGTFNQTPVLVGTMADERGGRSATVTEVSRDELTASWRSRYGDHVEMLLDVYSEEITESTKLAQVAIQTDRDSAGRARSWARLVYGSGNDAYVYFFSQPTQVHRLYIPEQPAFPIPEGPRGWGAFHSGDLIYVFDNLDLVKMTWDAWDREIAQTISQYWVNFARTGDPNGVGLPEWPRYEPAGEIVLQVGSTIEATVGPRTKQLDALDHARAAAGL